MENNKKSKTGGLQDPLCNTCDSILTDNNKVTGKKICKTCHAKKSREYYEKNIQPKILAKQETKIEKDKTCNDCACVLTEENQVKGRNQCKKCRSESYKVYSQTKLSEKYSTFDGTKICSSPSCGKILTVDNCVKNRPICKDCYNVKTNDYKKNNKDKVLENHKEYYQANKDKIADYYKNHYVENKDTYLKNNQKWRSENRETIRKKETDRLHKDPTLRLIKACRTRIWYALKDKGNKNAHTDEYLDCTIEFLKKWLEYNFKDEMTLDNYGPYWHVDHVIPCARFNLEDPNEVAHCFHWVNLQPMLGSENMSKHDNIDNIEIISHYQIAEDFADENNIEIPDFNYEKYLEDNEYNKNEIKVK